MVSQPLFTIGRTRRDVIEVDKDYLKYASAEISKKGIVITRLLTHPVSDLSDEELATLLSNLIIKYNIALDETCFIIPRDKVMLRFIRLPAIAEEEIKNMVSFEITKQSPYSEEEVVSDYIVAPAEEEGYSDVMLAIAHKSQSTKIDSLLDHIGKKANRINLSSEALVSWLGYYTGQEGEDKGLGLLDIDTKKTELIITSNGRLDFSRIISVGAEGILRNTQDPPAKSRLVDEVRRSLDHYLKEQHKEPGFISEFIVTGADPVLKDVSRLLQNELRIQSREVNIFSTLTLSEDALTEGEISKVVSMCGACGGLFLSKGINLVSEEVRGKERLRMKVKGVVGALIFCVLCLGLLSSALLLKLHQKRSLLASMKSMLGQLEPMTEVTEEKMERLDLVKNRFSEGTSSLDVILNLYKIIPGNVSLIDFDYDEDNHLLRFRGTALKMSDVFKLATLLESSGRFSKVETRSVNKRRTKTAELVDFQMRGIFITEGK